MAFSIVANGVVSYPLLSSEPSGNTYQIGPMFVESHPLKTPPMLTPFSPLPITGEFAATE